MEKVGKLHQNATPIAGNLYWIAFSNSGRRARPIATAAREDMEAGRASMCKQADAGAQVAVAAQALPLAPAGLEAVQNVAQPDALHATGNCQSLGRRQPPLLLPNEAKV